MPWERLVFRVDGLVLVVHDNTHSNVVVVSSFLTCVDWCLTHHDRAIERDLRLILGLTCVVFSGG
jgi:hypothetical protein